MNYEVDGTCLILWWKIAPESDPKGPGYRPDLVAGRLLLFLKRLAERGREAAAATTIGHITLAVRDAIR
jgi:hypothetical protein